MDYGVQGNGVARLKGRDPERGQDGAGLAGW
jgi:hypothetical protein